MPLISIVVPIYNVEIYIEKCLESLINQTYKNIEIILVNDGSTDLSGYICDDFATKDKRIKVIHKSNGGLSDARNIGIDVATGDYIAFIDSDDWIDLKMIEILYKYINTYNADIAQGDYIEVYDENIVTDIDICEEVICYNSEKILESLYGRTATKTVIACNKLYKRELFEKIRFPKGKLHEDEFTTYKLLYSANLIVDSNLPIYYYRQRQGSIMKSEFSIRRLDTLEAWKERKKFFDEKNLKFLVDKTEDLISISLKYFYIKVKESNIFNKDNILYNLEREVRSNYKHFIRNKEISIKGKMALTLFIINPSIFYQIYKNLINE